MPLPKLILRVFRRNIPCEAISWIPALLLSAENANQIMRSRVDNKCVANMYRLFIIANINPINRCITWVQSQTIGPILNVYCQTASTACCINVHRPIYLLRWLSGAKLNWLWNQLKVYWIARIELNYEWDCQRGDCIYNDNIKLLKSSKCILQDLDLITIYSKWWGIILVFKVDWRVCRGRSKCWQLEALCLAIQFKL